MVRIHMQERAVKHSPSAAVFSNGAGLHMRLGDAATALAWHRRAVELGPDNAMVLTNAGYAAAPQRAGGVWQAVQCAQSWRCMVLPRYAMEQSGELREAFQLYTEAYRLLPSHQQVRTNFENLRARLAAQGVE